MNTSGNQTSSKRQFFASSCKIYVAKSTFVSALPISDSEFSENERKPPSRSRHIFYHLSTCIQIGCAANSLFQRFQLPGKFVHDNFPHLMASNPTEYTPSTIVIQIQVHPYESSLIAPISLCGGSNCFFSTFFFAKGVSFSETGHLAYARSPICFATMSRGPLLSTCPSHRFLLRMIRHKINDPNPPTGVHRLSSLCLECSRAAPWSLPGLPYSNLQQSLRQFPPLSPRG